MRNIIIALIVLVILVGGFFILKDDANAPVTELPQGNTSTTTGTGGNPTTTPGGSDAGMEDDGVSIGGSVTVGTPVVVTYTDEGFAPASVPIRKGMTVRFVNDSETQDVWPASAIHPTHGVYPVKSASDCLGSSFDACRALKPGESWEFTFTEAGTWRYHDHLHASKTGTIVVTE